MDSVEIRQEKGVTRILMPENFTASLVPSLQSELKQLIENGVRTIVFDLSATRMLDSSGIGLLTATSNSLATIEGRLEVVSVMPEIYRLLQMMRLVERLNVSE